MSFGFKEMADAIATRFSSTYVTPPSGEENVSQSTASLPAAITDDRTVLVFPMAQAAFEYPPSARKGVARYPVRFYLYEIRSTPRNTELLNSWATSLHTVLDGQTHLGLSADGITGAEIVRIEVGPLSYGGIEFHGIEFTVDVHFGYGVTFTA